MGCLCGWGLGLLVGVVVDSWIVDASILASHVRAHCPFSMGVWVCGVFFVVKPEFLFNE